MRHKTTSFISVCLTCILLLSCSEYYQDGDWFYVQDEGAIMPVWVRGNVSSGIFIVFLHGGPGESAIVERIAAGNDLLEEHYAVVYWDQRGSGIAQGNPSPATYNLDQFAEDVDLVVDVVKQKYDVNTMFMMGHSFGGMLGTEYLLDDTRQDKIAGWIAIDGIHNDPLRWELAVEWVVENANLKIQNGENTSHWEGELEWYNTFPDPPYTELPFEGADEIARHSANVFDLNGWYYDGSYPESKPEYVFASPISLAYVFTPFELRDHWDEWFEDRSPEMYKITIPSLILWGRHDGGVPVELAPDVYDSLGTQAEEKEIVIFENSAHHPHEEEPELFTQVVVEFIQSVVE